MYKKDFEHWHTLKRNISTDGDIPKFNDRDIWWCSIGVNVGHESDGKGELFNRPILVVKKFNARLFWGVPLSTQTKDSYHYHQFTFSNRKQSAMLTQLRLWDAQRLTQKMGRLAEKEFLVICEKLKQYLP